MTGASVFRRQGTAMRTPLAILCQTADDRIDMATRKQGLMGLKVKAACCVGDMVFKILSIGITLADFFIGGVRRIIVDLTYMMSYVLSCADAERRHNRSKQTVTKKGSNDIASFCAKAILDEWRCLSVRSATRLKMICDAVQPLGDMDVERSVVASLPTCKRKSTSGYGE